MLRMVFAALKNCHPSHSLGMVFKTHITKNIMVQNVRYLETLPITKNLDLYTKDKIVINKNSLKVLDIANKPLVLLLPWVKAKPEHLMKFIRFYIDHGFDVLTSNIGVWKFLWPQVGTQLVAKDIVKFLRINEPYFPLFIHGFSASIYLWGETLIKIDEEKCPEILKRIVGQVWDSSIPIQKTCCGLAASVFPKSEMMQSSLRPFINLHMKIFDNSTTCHHLKSIDVFQNTTYGAPAQLFASKSDNIGLETANKRLGEYWAKKGIKVYWKSWDDSPHAQNFRYHPTEYLSELTKFLEKVKMIKHEN